ncbi:MAG: SCO family protein [Betaproteobacteria bacterium HGW-Betaproteobacteria-22]|nr:MAG: SCO family protein [Betaproteobacteria bacterium HGW-Betaproteobacteria-22]
MRILIKKFLSQLGLGLLLVGLVACKPTSQAGDFFATDITGVDFGHNLILTDHHGNQRSLSDFKGKVVALLFGYTHCPDVCPTSMVDLKHTRKLLGARANELQVIFVTVDPERDTQQVLAAYVPAFDAGFIGLRGSMEETATVLKDFKIFAAKVENKGRSGYTIDHSAGIYVFDKTGQVRLYVDYGSKPSEIAADIEKLL